MGMTVLVRSGELRLGSLLLAFAVTTESTAATLEVAVIDEQGRPIENVAVYATPAHDAAEPDGTGTAADVAAAPNALMDQQGLQFVPHVLVVQAGTSVSFPNSDDVSHHVYSFSETKTFELPLYKGDVYPPVMFEQPGIVVMGCNIHDGMIGYVVVVDTPHFGRTNERGIVSIEGLANGDYNIAAWTPRVRPSGLPPAQQVGVTEHGTAAAEIRIIGRLAPPHHHGASSLTWERY